MRPAGLLFAAMGLAACARAPGPVLEVCAAASLRDALTALAPAAEAACGARLVVSFGASGDLARQVAAGAGADLFLSAGEAELDGLERAGLLVPGSRQTLLSNQLVVIEPADERPSLFTRPFRPAQLADGRLELLALAQPESVPAGRYARAWLEQTGTWPELAGRILAGVDVRATLAAVESGAVRAGIVYRTDAARSARVRIVHAVPAGEGPPISYPLARIAGRPHAEQARVLASFLASREALAVFERHGFLVPGSAQ